VEKIEGVIDHPVISAFGKIVLELREVGGALRCGGDDLAIDHGFRGRQFSNANAHREKALGPVQPATGPKRDEPAAQMRLQAVAVKLDFVDVPIAAGWLRSERSELRLYES